MYRNNFSRFLAEIWPKNYLSNSKTFQDGNGNGNFKKINSYDFLDGNWESMEMKG